MCAKINKSILKECPWIYLKFNFENKFTFLILFKCFGKDMYFFYIFQVTLKLLFVTEAQFWSSFHDADLNCQSRSHCLNVKRGGRLAVITSQFWTNLSEKGGVQTTVPNFMEESTNDMNSVKRLHSLWCTQLWRVYLENEWDYHDT